MSIRCHDRSIISAGAIAALALGCATASVSNTERYVSETEVRRPSTVVVHDFAVSAGDVLVDTLGPEFVGGDGDRNARTELGREVSQALAESLVAKLRERGITAERAGGTVPLDALVLKGQFLTIDEGDRTKRVLIGFGAGSSEVRVRVQVYQATASGLRRLSEAEAEASGNKMPGMAIPVAGGAAAGTAVASAAISGGMNIVKERRGGSSADAAHLAEEIADRAEAFYKRQGWL